MTTLKETQCEYDKSLFSSTSKATDIAKGDPSNTSMLKQTTREKSYSTWF